MAEQDDVKSLAERVERLETTVSEFELVENRVSKLEASTTKVVDTLMPKVEELLSQRNTNNEPVSESAATPITAETLPIAPGSLLDLAERGDSEAMFRMLSEGEVPAHQIHGITPDGDSALHVAASGGHVKCVFVLLGAGINIDTLGHRCRTPLHCAAANGHLQFVLCLLDSGANPAAKDRDGKTAFRIAIEEGHTNIVKLLARKMARPSSVFQAAERGDYDAVEYFLHNGGSIDACNEEGDPLLVLAAKAERWNMVELLLEKGASAAMCKEPEECALVFASRAGRMDVVLQLLRRGARTKGRTEDEEQVQWGLSNAKSAAVVWAFVHVVPDALQADAGAFSLVAAAGGGRLEPMMALIDAGVGIDARDCDNSTALHLASGNKQIACVRELLRRGADIEAKDKNGSTPLLRTTQNTWGIAECVHALVEAGANTAARDNNGKTPRDFANSDAVRQLLKNGV